MIIPTGETDYNNNIYRHNRIIYQINAIYHLRMSSLKIYLDFEKYNCHYFLSRVSRRGLCAILATSSIYLNQYLAFLGSVPKVLFRFKI